MSIMTFTSIGSTVIKKNDPYRNFANTASNIIPTTDKFIYVFETSAVSLKEVKRITFRLNVTDCHEYREYIPPIEHVYTPKISDIYIKSCNRDITNEITYSNHTDIYDRDILLSKDTTDVINGINVYSYSFDYNRIFHNYVFIQSNIEGYVDATKQAELVVEYEEPQNEGGFYSPYYGDTYGTNEEILIHANVRSSVWDVESIEDSITATQGGKTLSAQGKIYTIPKNSFSEGQVNITYNAIMNSGNNVTINTLVNLRYPRPYAVGEYPIGNALKASNPIVFQWSYSSLEFESKQESITITITQNGNTITRSATTSNNFYELPANTLSAGDASYTITVVNDIGLSYTTDSYSFIVTGATSAPNITSISQTSIPEITWTATYQDAYEVRLFDGDVLLYDSGLVVGPNLRSAKLPVMLKNGAYNMQIRALNSYGVYTDWASYSYVLSAPAPNAPTNVRAKVNENYGVELYAIPPDNPGKLYAVRRDMDGNEVVLGEYIGGFTDFTAKPNTPYEYTVRNYVNGYADGEWIAVRVVLEGVVLYNASDMSNCVKLNLSTSIFEISRTEESRHTLVNCLGRVYPVKERTEWANSIRQFLAFISDNDIAIVSDMTRALKVYYKAEKEFFACDVTTSETSDYISDGKIIKFTITRIDEKEVSVL